MMHSSLHKKKREVPFARNKEKTGKQSTQPVNWGCIDLVDD